MPFSRRLCMYAATKRRLGSSTGPSQDPNNVGVGSLTRSNPGRLVSAGLSHKDTEVFITTALRSLLSNIKAEGCDIHDRWQWEVVSLTGGNASKPLHECIELHVSPPEGERSELPTFGGNGNRLIRFHPNSQSDQEYAVVWQEVREVAEDPHSGTHLLTPSHRPYFRWRWFKPSAGPRTVAEEKADLMALFPPEADFPPAHIAGDFINVRFYEAR